MVAIKADQPAGRSEPHRMIGGLHRGEDCVGLETGVDGIGRELAVTQNTTPALTVPAQTLPSWARVTV